MENINKTSPSSGTNEVRDKTDISLKDERHQADSYIGQKSIKIENEADESIRLNRLEADKKREDKRSKNDDQQTSTKNALGEERQRSDKALDVAQEKVDEVLAKERDQRQKATKVMLEIERSHTDSDLSNEREVSDLVAEEEKNSHDVTKTALDKRNQFLAMVSHDLKNPLSAVLISVGVLQKLVASKTIDQEKIIQCLSVIEQSSRNMDRMINELLDLERISNDRLVLNLEQYDICVLLKESIEFFSPLLISKSFTMEHDSCPASIKINIDRDRIFQVLSNLIGNALKFAPAGGIIKLSSKIVSNNVEVSVSDNGPGIPEEKRKEIFERFSQLHTKDRRGLGLGLFISKWIVEEHQGRIWVTDNEKGGSVFTFSLPLKVLH